MSLVEVYLKSEDLNHTVSHIINYCIGKAYFVKHLGKTKVIAKTTMKAGCYIYLKSRMNSFCIITNKTKIKTQVRTCVFYFIKAKKVVLPSTVPEM